MNVLTLATASGGVGSVGMILYIIVIVALLYFMMIRPQKKEQSRKNELFSNLAVGDTVLTTSGFYGTLVDIQDDMVIVEFGSNKNCRIPMQIAAIADVEKPEDSLKASETKADKKSKDKKKDSEDK